MSEIKLLSLDISSTTIGWAVFKYNKDEFDLIDYGFIKPPKKNKGSISFRLNETMSLIKNLISKHGPDQIAVEDYAKGFSAKRSHANTIITLSTFNETVCLAAYQSLNKDVCRYPVATIRSRVGKLFGIKTVSKEDIFSLICQNATRFKLKLNKQGNVQKENMDTVDGIAVGIAHMLVEGCHAKRYSL